jgi:hypothetical protein
MEYLIGAGLGLGVSAFATVLGYDRSRAFYPTIVIIVASYYVLFAVMAGAASSLSAEAALFALFVFLSVIGFRASLWFAAAALTGHGLLDVVHGDLIANPGVPLWWPGFCMAYDVVAGLYLALLLVYRAEGREEFAAALRPLVAHELRLAGEADAARDATRSFHHLERAHVLSQSATAQHVRVHLRMLRWGVQYRRPREIFGQLFRIIGAAALTRFAAVPHGNTGGTNVSAFQPMPIAQDLSDMLARAKREANGAPCVTRP